MAEGGDVIAEQTIQEVLRKALVHDGLARGLREAVKALDRRSALLCVLSKNCTEAAYSRLVEALCNEHGINLLKVPDGKKLGEWAGLCKYDKDGQPRKVVNCSCVVVKEFGEQSEALTELLEYFKKR